MRKYNLKRDPVDNRDKLCAVLPSFNLPEAVDLRSECPPISDQEDLGCCSTHASVAGAWDFLQMKEFKNKTPFNEATEEFTPAKFENGSRLFAYYNERVIEGTVDEDSGCTMRDAIKSLHQYGCCPEIMWPYDISKFTVKPSDDCYATAAQHKISEYSSLICQRQMKTVLAQGYIFISGIDVYESLETDEVMATGIIPDPDPSKEKFLGGHAISIVGYNTAKSQWIMRNSWGEGVGDKGYFYFSDNFMSKFANGQWLIKL